MPSAGPDRPRFYRPRRGAFRFIPKPAIAPFTEIVKKLMEETIAALRQDPHSQLSQRCIMALQSAVGIFSVDRHTGKEALLGVLKEILIADSISVAILSKVLRMDPPVSHSAPPPPGSHTTPLIPPKLALKIAQLVSSKQCGAALSKLESFAKREAPVSINSDPSVMAAILTLHPPASLDDKLPEIRASVSSFKLKVEDITKSLNKLPKGSSPGLSTWSFEVIKTLLQGSEELLALITQLFNLILSGNGGSSRLWNACCITPISKAKGGIRPIAVADTWMRLLSRVVAGCFAESAGETLSPLQVGVGVSSGAEHIIHIAKAHAHVIASSPESNKVILQVDGRNAFNSIRRRFILDRILSDEKFAPLARFFAWSYGSPTPLYDEDGLWITDSDTGVRQGDPLGPLLFALGFHGVLESVNQRHPDVEIYGYLDDITIAGEAIKVVSAYKYLVQALLKIGIIVNGTKSQGHCAQAMVETLSQSLGDVPVSSEGLSVLGCPIGSDNFVKAEAWALLGNYSSIVPLVLSFAPKVAYLLLEQCINKRPNYLLRTVCPWLVEDPAVIFDTRISKAIHSLVAQDKFLAAPPASLIELDMLPVLIERADAVRALPRTMGGLGIRKAVQLSKPAWTASLINSWKWISEKTPNLMGSPCNSLFSDASYQGLLSSSFECTMGSKIDSAAQLVEYFENKGKIPTQTLLTQLLVDEPQQEALRSLLAQSDDFLAYYNSESADDTGFWLSAGLSSCPALSLTNSEFIENVGLRLLLSPIDADPQVSLICPCDNTRYLVPGEDTFHCFSCMGKQGQSKVFHYRHNGARDLAAEYFRKACPNAQIFIEPTLPQVAKPLRADVRIEQGRTTCLIDVAVVNPAARSYLKTVKPQLHLLAAASLMEKTKIDKYKASYNVNNGYAAISDNLIPFVLESTGAYGNSASAVINKLAGFKDLVPVPHDGLASARRWFMQRLSILFAKSRYQLVCLFRRNVVRIATPTEDPFLLDIGHRFLFEDTSSSPLDGEAPVLN